jgi:hypothetical protein
MNTEDTKTTEDAIQILRSSGIWELVAIGNILSKLLEENKLLKAQALSVKQFMISQENF